MITTQIDISKDMGRLIEERLRAELEKEIDQAIERFEARKGEIVAGLIVNMMRSTDMRIMQDRIVFEIKSPSKEH